MPPAPRTIAVVTSSRADYAHLYWPLREMEAHPALAPRLIVTGAHLSPEFGRTADEIERDGFEVAERVECLLSADTRAAAMARTIGLALIGFAAALERLRPDLLFVVADRYEMLAPAIAGLSLRLPIVHLEGGEASEWAIDHAVRNAITMMSHVHLATTERAARRLVAMGEEPWRVHRVGAPSLDHLRRGSFPTPEETFRRLGLDPARAVIVVACHPVTLRPRPEEEAGALLEALAARPEQIAFGFPNADAGSRALIEEARRFCAGRTDARLFVNLGREAFWSLLRGAAAIVGNSSSGIMESPSLELPAVNVGGRQQGRERAANVIDAEADAAAIGEALARALDPSFRAGLRGLSNPYGDGEAAPRIARILAEVPLGPELLVKR